MDRAAGIEGVEDGLKEEITEPLVRVLDLYYKVVGGMRELTRQGRSQRRRHLLRRARGR